MFAESRRLSGFAGRDEGWWWGRSSGACVLDCVWEDGDGRWG